MMSHVYLQESYNCNVDLFFMRMLINLTPWHPATALLAPMCTASILTGIPVVNDIYTIPNPGQFCLKISVKRCR